MSRKLAWATGFLTVTALAIGMEIYASTDGDASTQPWTSMIVDNVPAVITFTAIGVLVGWIGPHFTAAYAKKGESVVDREPVITVGTVTAGVAAVLALLVAFGVDLTETQTTAVLGVVAVVAPVVSAYVARRWAWSPASVRKMVAGSKEPGAG